MPTRFLKQSICCSTEINELDSEEEVLFYRLLVNCDDFGRFYASARIIKGLLFPLRDSVTFAKIEKGLAHLNDVGLLFLYHNKNESFLQIVSWDKHQSNRAKKSKFPTPDEFTVKNAINCNHLQAFASNCHCIPNTNTNTNRALSLGFINKDLASNSVNTKDLVSTNGVVNNDVVINDIPYAEIIVFLNERIGTHYKTNSKKTKSLIHARFADGFTLEDFKNVIDKKANHWIGTEQEQYLTPDTLFSGKFEKYLNQARASPKKETVADVIARNTAKEGVINDTGRSSFVTGLDWGDLGKCFSVPKSRKDASDD